MFRIQIFVVTCGCHFLWLTSTTNIAYNYLTKYNIDKIILCKNVHMYHFINKLLLRHKRIQYFLRRICFQRSCHTYGYHTYHTYGSFILPAILLLESSM